ncbi:MAG: NADAR family protein [Candidatus Paceibacterota bacterium]|jgi:hypothetical protein
MKKILYTDIGPSGTQYKKGEWEQFVIHNDKEVKGFMGPYRFLSNFWPAKVFLDDVEYKSVELAYQAAKWKPEHRGYFQTCTELEAIKHNEENKPHDACTKEEWAERKLTIMTDLVTQKFNPLLNPENTKLLLDTGQMHLEEMNWWNDLYWGTNKEGEGENQLGKLLMKVRKDLQ